MKIQKICGNPLYTTSQLQIDCDKADIRALQQLSEQIGTIDPNKEYDIKIAPVKKSRSLDANAYMWVLSDRLAKVLRTTKEGNLNIETTKKLLVGEANEPMLLGTTTSTALEKEKKALTDCIAAINNVTPAPVPPSSPDPTWALVKAALVAIVDRGDYSKIKSEKSFLD